MSGMTRHLIVFEPDPRGHAEEWLNHLAEAVVASPRPHGMTLLVSEALKNRLPQTSAVRVECIDKTEQALCTHKRLAVSAFARWHVMHRHLRRTHATHGLFLSIDHLSLPLGLGMKANGLAVSGILFRPSVHYGEGESARTTPGEWVRDKRKDILYRRMLDNAAVHTVFSLDPYFPDFARVRYRNGGKVVGVPDPAYLPSTVREPETETDSSRRISFTLFGEISHRKGVLQLLDAAALLPFQIARRTEIVVAGRIDAALRKPVAGALASVRRLQPALAVEVFDRRLEVAELAALVEKSDVILAPYQKFVGSSGVILWAARYGRPIICQDVGLLGRLARDNGLGIAVDTTDPSAIADAIAAVVTRGADAICDRGKMASFVADRAPGFFARTILDRTLWNDAGGGIEAANDSEKSQEGTACSQQNSMEA